MHAAVQLALDSPHVLPYRPAEQLVHAAVMPPREYLPGEHSEQGPAAGPKKPALHTHADAEVEPVPTVVELPGQVEQAAEPTEDLYVPAPHGLQAGAMPV